MTHAIAPLAHPPFAARTTSAFAEVDRVAAGLALNPMPVCQRDVGAVGVVRVEHLADDHEEVKQPSIGQRPPDRCKAFSFAEPVIADMGMRG